MPRALFGPVHVIGLGCTPLLAEQDAVLDRTRIRRGLHGIGRVRATQQDVGLSVQASMDIYDGRSISSGMTTAAAGGYLNRFYRVGGSGCTARTPC